MKCENMIGKDFDNLTQRIVYAYKSTYPEFIPIEHNDVTKESQKDMYDFLSNVICYIYDNPTFIHANILPDDYYEDGVMNNTKPQLILTMKNIEKKLYAFYEFLYNVGELSELVDNQFHVYKDTLKITNDKLKKLELLGIKNENNKEYIVLYSEKYPKCFPAWKLLSQICNHKIDNPLREFMWFMFMHCIYDVKHVTAQRIYGDLIENNGCLEDLQDFFCDNGYEYSFKDNRLLLRKDYPDKQYGYMSLKFEWRRRDQMDYYFRVPNFRVLLNDYDKMDDKLKEFVFFRTKTCDNCSYCTQTDKSGKRKPVHLFLQYNSETLLKCPLYPNFSWSVLTPDTVLRIKKLYSFAEDMLYKQK